METTFSTAFSTSPLAASGGGGHSHSHHLFSTNSLHLQIDNNANMMNSGIGNVVGGGSSNGGVAGSIGGGGSSTGSGVLMMMGDGGGGGGHELSNMGVVNPFYSGLGTYPRRLTDPPHGSGGGGGGGLMWMMGGHGNGVLHPGNNGVGGASSPHFQLSTTLDVDPFSEKAFDAVHRTFHHISNELHTLASHEASVGTGGGGGGSTSCAGNGSMPPPPPLPHAAHQHASPLHSILPTSPHHSRFYPGAPSSTSSHPPGSPLPLGTAGGTSHPTGTQVYASPKATGSAGYPLSPTGAASGSGNTAGGTGTGVGSPSSLSPVLHPHHLQALVDPHNPMESAVRLNEAVAKLLASYHPSFLPHSSHAGGEAESVPKEVVQAIASIITTPAHLSIVTRLDERFRKDVRDLVLHTCLIQLGAACEEVGREEGTPAAPSSHGSRANGEAGEVIPISAEILVEMAKLHLVRLSGVIAVVKSFLEKPASQRVGLAVLGRLMDQLRHNERFLSSVRSNAQMMVQLYNLHRTPEYEYDVLAITQLLLSPSPSARRSTGGETGENFPSSHHTTSGSRSGAGETETAMLYEGPVLKHMIPASPPLSVGGPLSSLASPPQRQGAGGAATPLTFSVPTTRMVYFSRHDELMTAHVDGTVVLWGDTEAPSRGKATEEQRREEGRMEEKEVETLDAVDVMKRRMGGEGRSEKGESEEEEEDNGQDRSSPEGGVGRKKREWTKPKGTLEMPNDCVAWAMAGHRSGRYFVLAGHPPSPKSPYHQFFQGRRSTLPPVVATTPASPAAMNTSSTRQPVLFVLGFSEANQQWTSARMIPRPQHAVVTALTALSPTTMCVAESRLGGGPMLMGAGEKMEASEDGGSVGHQLVLMDPMSSQVLRVLPHAHMDYITVLGSGVHIQSSDHVFYSGSRDKIVKVYDVRSQEMVVGSMVGHRDTVSAIAFHHQHLILTASLDGMLHAWDNRNVSEPLSSRMFSSPVLDMVVLQPGSSTGGGGSAGSSVFANGNSNGNHPSGMMGSGDSTFSDSPQLALATTRALYLLKIFPMDATDIIPNRCFTQLAANDEGSVLFAADTEGVHTFAVKRGTT